LDFGDPSSSKLLKRFLAVISGGKNMDVTMNWYRDYGVEATGANFTLTPTASGTTYLWNDSTALFGCNTSYDYSSSGVCSDGAYDGTNALMGYTSSSACTTAGYTWTDHASLDNCSSSPAKYSPNFQPNEYKIPLSKAAKVLRLEMKGTMNGFKAALQNMTIWAKRGKIR